MALEGAPRPTTPSPHDQPLTAPRRRPFATSRPVDLLIHLRLHFQLLLAPIFLLGWVLADGKVDARLALAFVVFHVFLYGGITAFNSAHDRDEGPVGGLERPPPVAPALLPFAVGVKLLGWALAWLVNPPFALLYGAIALLSVGYSDPRIRFKARPPAALATVAVGQGILPFFAAWAAARGDLSAASGALPILGALAATGIVLGFYPLTQLFQIEEDRARADRTVAVAWGPGGAFRLSLACLAVGGGALILTIMHRWGLEEALLVALGHLALLTSVARWAGSFQSDRVLDNYRRVMRLNTAGAVGFGGYLLAKLVLGA